MVIVVIMVPVMLVGTVEVSLVVMPGVVISAGGVSVVTTAVVVSAGGAAVDMELVEVSCALAVMDD